MRSFKSQLILIFNVGLFLYFSLIVYIKTLGVCDSLLHYIDTENNNLMYCRNAYF